MIIMMLIDWVFGNGSGFQIKTYFDLCHICMGQIQLPVFTWNLHPNHLLDCKLFTRLSPHPTELCICGVYPSVGIRQTFNKYLLNEIKQRADASKLLTKSTNHKKPVGWFGFPPNESNATPCELGRHCYGLNHVPQKMQVDILIPSTSECNFT